MEDFPLEKVRESVRLEQQEKALCKQVFPAFQWDGVVQAYTGLAIFGRTKIKVEAFKRGDEWKVGIYLGGRANYLVWAETRSLQDSLTFCRKRLHALIEMLQTVGTNDLPEDPEAVE